MLVRIGVPFERGVRGILWNRDTPNRALLGMWGVPWEGVLV